MLPLEPPQVGRDREPATKRAGPTPGGRAAPKPGWEGDRSYQQDLQLQWSCPPPWGARGNPWRHSGCHKGGGTSGQRPRMLLDALPRTAEPPTRQKGPAQRGSSAKAEEPELQGPVNKGPDLPGRGVGSDNQHPGGRPKGFREGGRREEEGPLCHRRGGAQRTDTPAAPTGASTGWGSASGPLGAPRDAGLCHEGHGNPGVRVDAGLKGCVGRRRQEGPHRTQVSWSRNRSEGEGSPNKLCAFVTCVPVTTFRICKRFM